MNLLQKELAGLYRKQKILGVLIFSFVTIVVWVSLNLFSSQTKTSISPELQLLAKPLTPTLNQEVIETIENKRVYDESQLQSFPIFKVITDRDRERTQASPVPNATTSLTTLTTVETPETASESPQITNEDTGEGNPATSATQSATTDEESL